MARTRTLQYQAVLSYKKLYEEKKLKKKEIERMVTYAGNHQEKKKDFFFSSKRGELYRFLPIPYYKGAGEKLNEKSW